MAMPHLVADERASFVTAILPMFLAVLGLLMIATGAIMNLFPLLLAGAGLAVIAVTMYMIASFMDLGDRRTRSPPMDRAARAKAAFEADRREAPTVPTQARSPLADHAVAALTGSAQGGGIYPPLPSQQQDGRAAQATKQPKPAPAVPMWEPGSAPHPESFNGRVVEFQEVHPEEIRSAVVAGHGTELSWDDTVQPAPRGPTSGSDRDFRIWPGAKTVDSWATFTGERKPSNTRVSDEDIRSAMVARRKEFAGKLPTVGAILAGVDAREDASVRDMSRGKCSQCESVIWAPKQRPILLKCPSCGHKAKLY